MDVAMRRSRRIFFGNDRGQTVVEYLLLLVVTFTFGYFIITFPVARFTTSMILTIRSSIVNLVRNAEMSPGQVMETGQRGHPGDPARAKPLHL